MAVDEGHRCSFCAKPREMVGDLITGPGGVCICSECIAVCNQILNIEHKATAPPVPGPDNLIWVGAVDAVCAQIAVAQLLFEAKAGNPEISIYITSPGGSVHAAQTIFDAMRFVRNGVATFCIGEARGVGALLAAAGTKGRRFALPNAHFSLHADRNTVALQEDSVELLRWLHEHFALLTGHPLDKIARDSAQNATLSAEEARAYGLVDEVVESPPVSGNR